MEVPFADQRVRALRPFPSLIGGKANRRPVAKAQVRLRDNDRSLWFIRRRIFGIDRPRVAEPKRDDVFPLAKEGFKVVSEVTGAVLVVRNVRRQNRLFVDLFAVDVNLVITDACNEHNSAFRNRFKFEVFAQPRVVPRSGLRVERRRFGDALLVGRNFARADPLRRPLGRVEKPGRPGRDLRRRRRNPVLILDLHRPIVRRIGFQRGAAKVDRRRTVGLDPAAVPNLPDAGLRVRFRRVDSQAVSRLRKAD